MNVKSYSEVKMSQVKKMYSHSADILNEWMEKLFPVIGQGCINFGYWKDIKPPLTIKKRLISQKNLYFKVFKKFDPNCRSVLEVGCGRGHGVFWLREIGYNAFGIDILKSQVERAKEQYFHLTPYFSIGKAEKLPFRNSSFDCIYSIEAAQHFLSFDEFCKESSRALKPNGKLFISTFFIKSTDCITELKKIIPDNLEGFHNALVISDAITLLENNGFKIDNPQESIGSEIFHFYASWQKQQLGDTSLSSLSNERIKWRDYYTGGGNNAHPWYQAFKNGWIDYYIIEARK